MSLELEHAYSSLNEAVLRIGNKPITLVIDETYRVTSTVIVPTNVSLVFADNGLLQILTGVTCTIQSRITALTDKQIFSLEGTAIINIRGGVEVTPEMFGAIGNTTNGNDGNDDTLALQAALRAIENSNTSIAGGGVLRLQARNYRITATLSITKYDVVIKGVGVFQSKIWFNGVAGGCIVAAANNYCRPMFEDFMLEGDSSSGHGIDFTNIILQTYNGELNRLYITSGGACIKATDANLFSFKVSSVYGKSFNNHVFFAHMGPCVTWQDCYVISGGADKCGYRFSGSIVMINCNGANTTDYWGIFGSDTGGVADGFENDFPNIAYPDITLIGCNVEAFTKRGIYVCQSYNQFTMTGGKIDRSAFATAYHSLVSFKKNSSRPHPARFNLGYVFKGAGVPNGDAGLTNAWIHSVVGAPIVDESGAFIGEGILGVYSVPVAGLYPLMTAGHAGEAFQNVALTYSSLMPTRLTCKMVRYQVSAALTPVGAAQAIVVTGNTKWLLTPAAAASISTATFVATLGVTSDYDRNGDLIVEATNANLTVNHTALGGAQNTFVMAAGANLAMGVGQVIRFLRSTTTNQWIQY